MWSHYRVLRSLHCSQTEKYCIQNDFWNFVLSLTENERTRHLISCRLISREKICTEKSISHGEIRWGKISVSTKDSCPNQINSKVKWSALNHIFALVENASNRQKKDLERVQKQRARVWGSHPSGKNFTPALRFTRLVILYPDLLSTKSIRELGTRLRALQREGFLEKNTRLCRSLLSICTFCFHLPGY